MAQVNSFEAEPLNVLAIWSANISYECPLFQRKYTWKEAQWTDFWEDVQSILDGSEQRRFLGALVLKASKAPLAMKFGATWVVDGQQRLTTVYLALLALGTVAKEHLDEETVVSVQSLITYVAGPGRVRHPRLLPTMADLPSFVGIHSDVDEFQLAGVPVPAEYTIGATLRKAFRYQLDHVSDLLVEGDHYDPERAKRLLEVLATGLDFVAIYLDEEHDPQEVFDRLNQGGKRLALSDLLKNVVFSALSGGEVSYIDASTVEQNDWHRFMDAFSTDSDQAAEAFSDYVFPFSLCVNSTSTKGRAIADIEKHWTREFAGETSLAQIRSRIADLGRYQQEFMALREQRILSTADGSLQGRVDSLRRSAPPNSVLPYVMQALHAVRTGESSTSHVSSCLLIVESFLMRRALSGIEPTGLHAVFKDLWARAGSNPETLLGAIETGTVRMPTDQEVRSAVLGSDMYSRRKCAIFLREYEIHLRSRSPEDFHDHDLDDLKNVQVDHIMPKRIQGSSWPAVSDSEKYVFQLWGNLVLLSKTANRKKARKSWADTKALLEGQERFLQASEVIRTHSSWSLTDIKERTEMMASWALSRWPMSTQ